MNQAIYEFNLPKGKFQVYNGKPDFDFLKVIQIHSNVVLNENEITPASEADGIVATSNNILATLTADCLPLIIEGKLGHAILHAGWKGVKDQILLVEKVRALQPETIFIGPHISVSNYEVGEEFKNNFPNSNSFKLINNKVCFDLRNEIKNQIKSNYPNANVLDISICTFDDLKLNSFRRDKTKQRNYNVYIPNGAKT